MSHIVTISTKVQDPAAVAATCQRLALPSPIEGTATLFSGEATGLLVKLPGWHYPVVLNIAEGEIKFDNFEGHWGDPAELDRFLQIYAVETAKIEARKQGFQVTEQPLEDGSIRLQIVTAG